MVSFRLLLRQLNELLDQAALEVSFVDDLGHQVIGEAPSLLIISVTLDDLRNQVISHYSLVHHVQEVIKVWKQHPLATRIVDTHLVKVIDDALEQISVVELFIDQ